MRIWNTCLALASLEGLVVGHSGHHESEAVQYCLKDEFCMAQAAYANPSTSIYDLYITLQVDGFNESGHGWRAVGLGTAMQGALIFVVYGNPSSGESPVLSVRTVMEGHHPPLPLPPDYGEGVQVQTVYAKWTPIGDLYRAELNLICYNCTRWPGTLVEASSSAQPWIWAHNPSQPFEAHSNDALLQMHSTDTGNGYGFFFTDMALSQTRGETPPDFPKIDEEQSSNGASAQASSVAGTVSSKKSSFRHRAWQAHGLLLTIAFLLIYPLGVLLLRRQSTMAFKLHWITQVCASILVALGALIGIYLHPEIEHLHQLIGLAVALGPISQALLGWRHHVIYLRISRPTMYSEVHVLLGRVLMGLGAINILLGMVLKHWSAWTVILVALVTVAEACGLAFLLLRVRRPQRGQKYAQLDADDHDGAVALEDVESPAEDDDDDGSEKEMPIANDHDRKDDEK